MRTSASGSTNCPSFFSSSGSSSILVFGSRLSASARIAATRRGLSLLDSRMVACVSVRSDLISASCSFASARSIAGSIASSAPLCSSFAAARRTSRSVDVSLSAAIEVASSPRTRLLSTTSSRFSGTGVTSRPVTRSTAFPPLIHRICSPAVCTSPAAKACSRASASAPPIAVTLAIASTFASFSPSARSRTTSGEAPNAMHGPINAPHMNAMAATIRHSETQRNVITRTRKRLGRG